MKIDVQLNGQEVVLNLDGSLETTTANILQTAIEQYMSCDTIILECTKLEYVSSAGLRVLLCTQKTLNDGQKFVMRNPNNEVMDIMNLTGFNDIIDIER